MCKLLRRCRYVLLYSVPCVAASYPCGVDTWIDPAESSQDYFGAVVSIDGDIALINAPRDDESGLNAGAVYISEQGGMRWTGLVKLMRPEPSVSYGGSAELQGATAVIGVTGICADIWRRDGPGVWTRTATLIQGDGDIGNYFARSVAISGAVVAVGAIFDNDQAPHAGAIYMYEQEAGGDWPQVAELHASDGQGGDEMGISLDLDGDTLVAGAWADDDLGWNSGAAYVFQRGANGLWGERQKLLAADGLNLDNFGLAVAIRGDTIMVGAPGAGMNPGMTGGAVYVFQRDADGVWRQTQKLFPPDGDSGAQFGYAISIDGPLTVIGAPQAQVGALVPGAAYVYQEDAGGVWSLAARLDPPDPGHHDKFGGAVAVSGTTAVIGAWQDDDVAEDAGSATIFRVSRDVDGNGVMDICEPPDVQATPGAAGGVRPREALVP